MHEVNSMGLTGSDWGIHIKRRKTERTQKYIYLYLFLKIMISAEDLHKSGIYQSVS